MNAAAGGKFVRLYLREGMMHASAPETEARMRELLSTTLFPRCAELLTEASPIVPQITLRLLFDIVNFKPNYASLLKSSGIAGVVLSIVDAATAKEPPVLAVALISKVVASSRIDPLELTRDPYLLFKRLAHVMQHVHSRMEKLDGMRRLAILEIRQQRLLEHAVDILDETLLRAIEVGADVSKTVVPIAGARHAAELLATAAAPSDGVYISTRCKAASCLSGWCARLPATSMRLCLAHRRRTFGHLGALVILSERRAWMATQR